MRHQVKLFMLAGMVVSVGACATPRSLPEGPTPIPTLIPATMPSRALEATPASEFAIQSYPARLPSAARGRPLYQTHCASCHGEDGNGVVPGARNFGDLDYMRGETPASFYGVTTEGRGEMPAFRDTLTSDERWDVLFYVWRFSTNADTLAIGQRIYATSCEACHGADGTGEVLGAADFTDLRFMDDRAPRDFYQVITQGKGSMPAWQGRLSQDERWAVTDYLRAFSYDPTLPGQVAAASQPTAIPSAAACGSDYPSKPNPFPWDDAAAIAAGQSTYAEACAVCHGADGAGTLPGAPDLSSPEAAAALRSNPGESLCIVAEGRNSMPGWKETLSEEQMWQVLTYMVTLGK